MMAYLNGVAIPDLLSLRTLIAKYASLTYSPPCRCIAIVHSTKTQHIDMTGHTCM